MGVKLEVMRVTTAECDDVSKRSSSRVLVACGDIKGETVSCNFVLSCWSLCTIYTK